MRMVFSVETLAREAISCRVVQSEISTPFSVTSPNLDAINNRASMTRSGAGNKFK